MASFVLILAAARYFCASSSDPPVMSRKIRLARSTSLPLVAFRSTMRFPYALPSLIMLAVVSMFSTSFWAVPDFIRVEPVRASGPVTGAMQTSTSPCRMLSGLVVMPMVFAPTAAACLTTPST